MRVFGRLFAAIIGFILAAIAASLFMMFAIVGFVPPADAEPAAFWLRLVTTAGLAASFMGAYAVVPAGILIALAEVFAWRAFLLYALAGAAIGVAGGLGLVPGADPTALEVRGPETMALFAATGAVGGTVYWLFAGRMAGLSDPRRRR